MRSLCREDELFLLLRLKLPVRSPRNLKRRWSLSLYNSLFPFLFFLSPFSFSYDSPLIVFSKEETSSPFHIHAFSLIFLSFSLFLSSLFVSSPKTKMRYFWLFDLILLLELRPCLAYSFLFYFFFLSHFCI